MTIKIRAREVVCGTWDQKKKRKKRFKKKKKLKQGNEKSRIEVRF